MATITASEATMKRCIRCNFKTTDEKEMHVHILDQRDKCGSTSYKDDKYKS